jgi:hydrogenase maturation protease
MRATLDGNEAAASVAYRLNEVCCIYPITPSSPMAELAPALDLEGEPLALLDAWVGHDEVILADTVLSGAPAGTVHRLDVSRRPLPTALAGPSTHAFGVADTIELARSLERLPAHVEIYGVEGSCFAPGARLTAAAQRGVNAVVAELVERFGQRPVKPMTGKRAARARPSVW